MVIQGETCQTRQNHRWLWAGKALFMDLFSLSGITRGIVVQCKILIEPWHSRLSSVATISICVYLRHHNSVMSHVSNDGWSVKLRFSDIIAGAQNSCLVAVVWAWNILCYILDQLEHRRLEASRSRIASTWPQRSVIKIRLKIQMDQDWPWTPSNRWPPARRVRTCGDAAVSRVEPQASLPVLQILRSQRHSIWIPLATCRSFAFQSLHYHSVITGFAQNECSFTFEYVDICLNHQNEVVSSGIQWYPVVSSGVWTSWASAQRHWIWDRFIPPWQIQRSVIRWYLMWVMRNAALCIPLFVGHFDHLVNLMIAYRDLQGSFPSVNA